MPDATLQHADPKSDIEIAQAATVPPILETARDRLGLEADALDPYGHSKAKLTMDAMTAASNQAPGKLILVTAITPTPAGEGKTTTTVGLGDALSRVGKRTAICLREPSLGPCFGMKGGAAGGGFAQVVPMEDINLHFTGDFHAIGTANNLLAALIDNHVHWGNDLQLDTRRIAWRRALDMNDRALRQIAIGLGGFGNGFAREDGFDITVASEVMAIFCLAQDLDDLNRRLGNIVIGYTRKREPVRAAELDAPGAMTALLKDALRPNLVQSLEGTPAFVHGGPFANIAHGCNSVAATKAALGLSDYVVTEAGFGADLGAEKFFNIKCRKAGLSPDAAVVVATVRALKMHGGVARADLATPDESAVRRGAANLRRHIENLARFGVPITVALNRFSADSEAEVACVMDQCATVGVPAVVADHWAAGGAGATDLAQAVVEAVEGPKARKNGFTTLYPDNLPLLDKVNRIAREIYRADGIAVDQKVRRQVGEIEAMGFADVPVCIAKTQYSFSTDPDSKGAPSGFTVPVREVRLAAGAGFVVVICGDIMTMPGLPRVPAAQAIGVDDRGRVTGLF